MLLMLQGCVKKNKRKKMMLTSLHLVFTISNMKFFWIEPIHPCPVHMRFGGPFNVTLPHEIFATHLFSDFEKSLN